MINLVKKKPTFVFKGTDSIVSYQETTEEIQEVEQEATIDDIEEISDEQASEIGVKETVLGMRIGKGPNWEIWVEPLNYVLSGLNKSNPKYYSCFEDLLSKLSENRIKFWLTQDKWNNVDKSMQSIEQEMKDVCKNLKLAFGYIHRKYEIPFLK
jgi:hypothetical protein